MSIAHFTLATRDVIASRDFFAGTLGWEPIERPGNIDVDPFFCNPNEGDFSLAENSPCVGTGENGANMGAFGVGCEEINLAPVLATIEDQQIAEDSELTIGVSATSFSDTR